MRGEPRVLLSTGSLHVMDLAAAFEVAAETGFDGVEVLCDRRWSTRDPDYLAGLEGRVGLPIAVLHAPFSSLGPTLPGWPSPLGPRERLNQTVRLAESLGAGTVVLHPPARVGWFSVGLGKRSWVLPLPWQTDPEHFKDWCGTELPAYQDTTAVKIAVENLPVRHFLGRRIEPAWYSTVEEWAQAHRWLTLDTTHWGTRGLDPLQAYRAARSKVAHVHLSDFGPKEHQLPGTGHLPLGSFLDGLVADDFCGTVSLELDPYRLAFSDGARLQEQLRDALAFCRRHLQSETASR